MILHYNITVTGKVQGVWFRKHTQQKAIELKLCGIVKNKTDGSVYIEAIGNETMLNELLKWLRTEGSPLSQVINVSYTTSEEIKNYTNFEIIK
jgi:acylphosphatase